MQTKQSYLVVFFLVIAAILLFWNLHAVPLFEPDEGRYGDIALEMFQSGDWLVPRMNYIVHLHKPPVSSWLVAGSFGLFGPSEFSARLPGALLSLLLLWGLIYLGRFLFDFKSGLYSGWILLTTALYLVASRLITADMTLTFFTFVSMACFLNLFFSDRNRLLFFYGALISLGFGMAAKGPIAWVITLLPAAVFAAWKRKAIRIPILHWLMGLILFLGISLGWYLAVVYKYPNALDYFLNYQLLGRIKGGTGHAYPFFYFLIVLPLGMLPWCLFLPTAFYWDRKQTAESEDRRNKFHFLVLWFAVPFICFSLFKTKLALYIVPLFLPLSLVLGFFWQSIDSGKIKLGRGLSIVFWVLAVAYIVFAVSALVFISIRPKFVEGIPVWGIGLGTAYLIVIACINFGILLKKKFYLLFRVQVGALVGLAVLGFSLLPLIHFKTTKVFMEKVNELRGPDDVVIMYDRYYSSMPFYLRDRVVHVGVDRESFFDTKEHMDNLVYPQGDSIKQFIEGPERIFVLSKKKMFDRAKSLTQRPLYILVDRGKYVLFSNESESRD